MKRILLTGVDGQLGQELQRTLAPLGEVKGVGRQTLDLTSSDRICQTIAEIKPDLIVNAAAYTAVDKSETESELAHLINGVAPTMMAAEQARNGGALIHVSTDYVFDGSKNTPYTEEDAPNPLGVYGKSKLAGEEGIQKTSQDLQSVMGEFRYVILRTAWVYGTYGKTNFVKTMLRLGADREEIRVVADQVGTPTWAYDIANAIAILGQQLISEPATVPSGIYNFTNSGVASWYDFAIAIFEEAQQLGMTLKVQRVVPITTSEYPTPATRPAYSVLAGQKTAAALGSHSSHWRQGLRKMLTELYSN
ncbi:dTDP-4-dehydrorhamnose reductase [Microcoleus sp. herbarium7]|uniref:dTDP-4-dehydrorhamnose reductase n=1 Tax=Microcoleus sp. herbarium7 TaxID=3055435 RepID=UPI002FD0E8A3